MGSETEDLGANPNSSMLLIASNWVTIGKSRACLCLSFLIRKMGMIISPTGVVVRCREVDLVSFEVTLVEKEM